MACSISFIYVVCVNFFPTTYRLLSTVGIQKIIHVVDVTTQKSTAALALAAALAAASGNSNAAATAASGTTSASVAGTGAAAKDGVHTLPAGLVQEELHVPTDEKDVYAYFYLNKVRRDEMMRFLHKIQHLVAQYRPISSSLKVEDSIVLNGTMFSFIAIFWVFEYVFCSITVPRSHPNVREQHQGSSQTGRITASPGYQLPHFACTAAAETAH